MALSCIISEISPLLIANRDFFKPVAFGAPVRGSSSEYCNSVWYGKKLEWWGYPMIGKTLRICITVYTEYGRVTDGRTDGQTDGRTDILPRHSPRYAYASRGKNLPFFISLWFLQSWEIVYRFNLQQNNYSSNVRTRDYKNLAIANRSRVSCAHNTLTAFIDLNNFTP